VTTYVSTSGSDGSAGTQGAPWRTIQKAVNATPAGGTVMIGAGTYAPFTISTPNLTVAAMPATTVTVVGTTTARDVILIHANEVTVRGLTVTGCVPHSAPSGGFESDGSSGVRIDDKTTGALLDGMTIRDSHAINADGLAYGCYGVIVHNASAATIQHSTIYHNGYGIFVAGSGAGIAIIDNTVHDNDVMIRNTRVLGDDFGGVGIGFNNTSGVTATGNRIYNNVAHSHDWGTDGGGFEIYNSSNIAIDDNTISNNEVALETGSGNGGSCLNNRFVGNDVAGRTAGSRLSHSPGLILRCANGMVVRGNTLTNLDWWTFWIYTPSTTTNGIVGLSITDNVIVQRLDQVYALTTPITSAHVTIAGNSYTYRGQFGTDWQHRRLTLNMWSGSMGFDPIQPRVTG
jgi:parallel beta-helix repeat protein